MTEINNLTVYMSFTGATPAAVKGEVEEYIREELTPAMQSSELKVQISVNKCGGRKDVYSLTMILEGVTYQEERIALLSWLGENALWEPDFILATAMVENENFNLTAETCQNNGNLSQLVMDYLDDEMLDWIIGFCREYETPQEQQAAADMAWNLLGKADKHECMTIALRRPHAS